MSNNCPVPSGKVNKLIGFFETDDDKPVPEWLRRRSSQSDRFLRQYSSDELVQKQDPVCTNISQTQRQPTTPPPTESPTESPTITENIIETLQFTTFNDQERIIDTPKTLMQIERMPSLTAKTSTSAADDACLLKKAFEQKKVDCLTVTKVLTCRTYDQRLRICDLYYELYGKSLVTVVRTELSGDFKKLMLALVCSPSDFYAKEINRSIKGLGTDENSLMDLLCIHDQYTLRKIADSYLLLFKCELKDAIKSDTSGQFKDILTHLLSPAQTIDEHSCPKTIAKQFAGGAKGSIEVTVELLTKIMTQNDAEFLLHLFNYYKELSGKHFDEVIKKLVSGDSKKALLIIYHSIVDSNDYFAEKLHRAMSGLGTDEATIIRIFVTRCEIDLKSINDHFDKKYPKSLQTCIKKETCGHFEIALLALLGYISVLDEPPILEQSVDQQTTKPMGQLQQVQTVQHVQEPVQECTAAVVVQTHASTTQVKQQIKEDHEKLQEEEFLKRILIAQKVELPSHFYLVNAVPTVIHAKCFDEAPISDQVEELRKAANGLKTDLETIIFNITKRNSNQRLQLISAYAEITGEDLCATLQKETVGHLQNTLVPLLFSRYVFLAQEVQKALRPFHVCEESLVELICSLDEHELREMIEAYSHTCGHSIEDAASKALTGPFRDFMLYILQCERDNAPLTHIGPLLYQLICSKSSSSEQELVEDILKRYSHTFLYHLFKAYETESGETFSEVITRSTTGIVGQALLTIYQCVMNRFAYFAGMLRLAMKGFGTNEAILIRIVVGRCEVDLENIKQEFERKYAKCVYDNIKSETSGYFRDALLSLVEGNANVCLKPAYHKQDSLIIHQSVDSPTQRRALSEVIKAQEEIGDTSQKETPQIDVYVKEPQQHLPSQSKLEAHEITIELSTNLPAYLSSKDLYPTIHEAKACDHTKDAHILKKAMKGLGTDEQTIIHVITKRSNAQCLAIAVAYAELFGNELIGDLRCELSGDFKKFIVSYVTPFHDDLAHEIKQAFKHGKLNVVVLAEILFTLGAQDLKHVQAAYERLFQKKIMDDVQSICNQQLTQILSGILEPISSHDKITPQELAAQLKIGGVACKYSLKAITENYDPAFLFNVFFCYEKLCGHTFLESLKSDKIDRQLTIVLSVLYECTTGLYTYFAKRLYEAMAGIGTDEATLSRIIISRCEIDLQNIKEKYLEIYGKALHDAVKSDTSSCYRSALLSVIEGNVGYECSYEIQTIKDIVQQVPAQKEYTFGAKELYENIVAEKQEEQLTEVTPDACDSFNELVKVSIIPPPEYDQRPLYLRGCEGTPTMLPSPVFNASSDVAVLRKAIKVLGTDEKVVLELLTNRDFKQRQLILEAYHTEVGKALIPKMKKKLSGDFEHVITSLLTPRIAFLTKEVNGAIKGLGTDEKTLAEVLCLVTEIDMKLITHAYQPLCNRSLKKDISDDTSGTFKDILICLVENPRKDPEYITPEEAAKRLIQKDSSGEIYASSDDIQNALVGYTHAFLYDTFYYVKKICGINYSDLIIKSTSGDVRMILLTIYQSISNRYCYFASRLNAALNGSIDEKTLTRIIIWRSEIDLENIKEEYFRTYGHHLCEDVKTATSGNYRKTLCSLLEKKNSPTTCKK